jgi:hypothetical protein
MAFASPFDLSETKVARTYYTNMTWGRIIFKINCISVATHLKLKCVWNVYQKFTAKEMVSMV